MEEKRYSIKCPYCGKEQYCTKSIFHKMGIYEMGSGNCLACKKHMQVVYNPISDTMQTRKWEEFDKEIREDEKHSN